MKTILQNEAEKMYNALVQIALGHTNDLGGDPSQWTSTIAGKALGWKWREGKRVK